MLMGDQMRRAWVDFLRGECRRQPVVIVLEDLHWGDSPTVEFMDSALRQLRSQPLFVLALARPEVRETFPGLWAERGLTEMGLGALSARACEKLVWRGMFEEGLRNAREAADIFPRGSELWNAALERLAWASGATANVEQLEAVAQELLHTTLVEGSKPNAIWARCSASIWFYSLGRNASGSAFSEVLTAIEPGSVDPLLAMHLHQWRGFVAAMSRHFEDWLWESRAEIVACERAGALRDACIARVHEGEVLISVGMSMAPAQPSRLPSIQFSGMPRESVTMSCGEAF